MSFFAHASADNVDLLVYCILELFEIRFENIAVNAICPLKLRERKPKNEEHFTLGWPISE